MHSSRDPVPPDGCAPGGLAAVVAEEDDGRVVGNAEVLQVVEDEPHVLVYALEHGGENRVLLPLGNPHSARMGRAPLLDETRPFNGGHSGQLGLVLRHELVLCIEIGVHGVV